MKYDVMIIGAGPGGIFSAYELYNDTIITDNSNLHWYCIQSGEKCGGVNINVFII